MNRALVDIFEPMTDATEPTMRSGPGLTGPVPLELGSRSFERPADAGSTLVAGLEGRAPARVDGGGLVTPWQADWSVDWWVGADDRWHLPTREPAVRQRRLGHGPVIETSLRVPSGDVTQTVYPVVVAGGTATVIEIRNDSPVPVALALALRPYPVHPATTAGRRASGPAGHDLDLDLDSGPAAVMVDSVPAILLPRRPNEAGACSDRDLLDEVRNGRALSWEGDVHGPSANAVCLYPLPHKTSLRFAIPGPGAGSFVAGDLPGPDAAARGWTAVVERPSRFQFPDSGISDLAGAARARLLLAANDLPGAVVDGDPAAGLILAGLATSGHRSECRLPVEFFSRSFPTEITSAPAGGDLARAIGLAVELLADPELCEAVLEPLAQLTHLTERAVGRGASGADRVARSDARRALARVAELAGQHQATDSLLVGLTAAPGPDLGVVTALSEQAAPARRWDDPNGADRAMPAARFWLAARELLLRDVGSVAGEPVIELLPDFPTAWRGGTVEVHRAPVAGALISFAIRWHGYRPALLWEVDGIDPSGAPGGGTGGGTGNDGQPFGPVRLICPGLDPTWETTERTGEALLAGSADGLRAAPAPGDSFG